MPQKAEADKTSWCYQVWFLLHGCMTRNSFKHDLLLTKLFFVSLLGMPLGVLSLKYGFNSVWPLFFEVVGTILLAIPAFVMLLRGYYEYQSEAEE